MVPIPAWVPPTLAVLVVAVLIASRGFRLTRLDDGAAARRKGCNVSFRVLADFGDYSDLLAQEAKSIIVLTPHNDEETRRALGEVLKGIIPCNSKVWVAIASDLLKVSLGRSKRGVNSEVETQTGIVRTRPPLRSSLRAQQVAF